MMAPCHCNKQPHLQKGTRYNEAVRCFSFIICCSITRTYQESRIYFPFNYTNKLLTSKTKYSICHLTFIALKDWIAINTQLFGNATPYVKTAKLQLCIDVIHIAKAVLNQPNTIATSEQPKHGCSYCSLVEPATT